jgi:hypothetical protein
MSKQYVTPCTCNVNKKVLEDVPLGLHRLKSGYQIRTGGQESSWPSKIQNHMNYIYMLTHVYVLFDFIRT